MAADGLITIESRHGPEETMNRFEAEVRARGMTVFAILITPLARLPSGYRCGRQNS
jgi:uncharacterized protein (DUF302 family)